MTDIKVPVSAPGSQQAAQDLLKTAAAAKELMEREEALAKGIKDFNTQIEKEASLLTGKLTPALKKAREEAAIYNAMMNQGRLSQGRSFLAGSSLGNGGGGGGFQGGTDGAGGVAKGIAQALGRMGGPGAQLFSGLGHAAGAASVGIGLLAGVAVIGGMAVRRWVESEDKRLQMIEEETKLRVDLNNTLRAAKEANQDAAKNTYMSNRDAYRAIAATSGHDAYQARGRIATLEKDEDPEALKAMAKFLRSRNGSRIGFDNGLALAHSINDTGAMSTSEALQKMATEKGHFTVDSIVGQAFGRRGRRGSADFTAQQADRVGSYWDLEGFNKVDDLRGQANGAGQRRGRDSGLIVPSVQRELRAVLDPVGVASEKFKKALDDNLEPLRQRAAAENEILRAYKENGLYKFLFNTESDNEKLTREQKKVSNLR